MGHSRHCSTRKKIPFKSSQNGEKLVKKATWKFPFWLYWNGLGLRSDTSLAHVLGVCTVDLNKLRVKNDLGAYPKETFKTDHSSSTVL